MEIKIKNLTPLWTGGVEGDCKKIKETGIVGSLRWWYEGIVRGLGGYVCDPTSGKKCELKQERFKKAIKENKSLRDALDEQICPACQVFGCGGWKKKFIIEIGGLTASDFISGRGPNSGLKKNRKFSLKFTLISPFRREEKWLLKKTFEVIENYGAIGGRATWKPNGRWGTPYGLIEIEDYGEMKSWDLETNKEIVKKWLEENKRTINKENEKDWLNFRFYWILKDDYLTRNEMNKIVNRDNFGRYTRSADDFDRWLGGDKGISKKIFSFKEPKNKVFGYVRSENELNKIKEKLEGIEKDINRFKTGKEIVEVL